MPVCEDEDYSRKVYGSYGQKPKTRWAVIIRFRSHNAVREAICQTQMVCLQLLILWYDVYC